MHERPFAERYLDHPDLPKAVPGLGRSRHRAARRGLRPHRHDAYECCLITEGTVDWFVNDEKWVLPPGSLFLTRPGEAHGAVRARIEPCGLRWIQIRVEALKHPELSRRLVRLKGRRWGEAEGLAEGFDRCLDELRMGRADARTGFELAFHSWFLAMLRHAENWRPRPPVVTRLREQLRQDPGELLGLRVGDFAARLGVSRGRVHQLFLAETGESPKAWLNAFRLRHAAGRLHDQQTSITDLAFECGFSSSQHFATAFRRYFGVTPTEFRTQLSHEEAGESEASAAR